MEENHKDCRSRGHRRLEGIEEHSLERDSLGNHSLENLGLEKHGSMGTRSKHVARCDGEEGTYKRGMKR